jgi:DNA-binding CsgD family transcriptional regulator
MNQSLDDALGASQLEAVLVQAHCLLDAALQKSRRERSAAEVEYLPDVDTLRAEALRLLPHARCEVVCTAPDAQWYLRARDGLDELRGTLRDLTQRGVTIRKLYTTEAISTLLAIEEFRVGITRLGVQVRVSANQLSEVVIVDGTAFLRVHQAQSDQCLMLRVPPVLRSLRVLYEAAWGAACDLDVYVRYRDGDTDEMATEILRMLSVGYKDETAARALGLSVRTYRRRVAQIMRDLNATSRFQAGVRAAELGLT